MELTKIVFCQCGRSKEIAKRARSLFICDSCRNWKIHTCQNCGNDFKSLRKTSQFCSMTCRSSKIVLFNTGRPLGIEQRNMISLGVTKSYQNGKPVSGGRTKWYDYKEIRVQGTYELRACKILDTWVEEKKILKWEYTSDRINYVNEGKMHSYLLDFKVYENEREWYYVEVKGFERPLDKLKWNAVREKFRLEVWFHAEIEKFENGGSSTTG